MSVDPLFEIYAGMTPYHYCGNNPVNYRDQSGMALQTDPGINNSHKISNNIIGMINIIRGWKYYMDDPLEVGHWGGTWSFDFDASSGGSNLGGEASWNRVVAGSIFSGT